MSLPSNTSENLTLTGVNLLGIDREIVPTDSMNNKNKVAEGGQWVLLNSENQRFEERQAILQERFR